jgi:quercetin dioxygenase-like cupin family protein
MVKACEPLTSACRGFRKRPCHADGAFITGTNVDIIGKTLPRQHPRAACRIVWPGNSHSRKGNQMSSFPIVKTGENVTRQVLADHPDLMMVAFVFEKAGAEGALHHHPHVQSTFVDSGRFRFTVGDIVTEVAQGDSFVVPTNVVHGCVCFEPGRLLDCFTPRRDDFL